MHNRIYEANIPCLFVFTRVSKAESSIKLPRVNNFDISQKKKRMEYLFHFMSPTRNKIWKDKS